MSSPISSRTTTSATSARRSRFAHLLVGAGLAAGFSLSAASALAAPHGQADLSTAPTPTTAACNPILASCDLTSKTTVTTSPPLPPCTPQPACENPPPRPPDVDPPVRANPSFTG